MYVEGVRDGRRFFESLKRAAARHPVLVWKGGMTEAGARATFSHTGSTGDAGGSMELDGPAERGRQRLRARRDARCGRDAGARARDEGSAGWAWWR